MPPGEAYTAKTRKPHRKSRNGCIPCKARHVKVRLPTNKRTNTLPETTDRVQKCDENKPACLNCEKYGSNCQFPQPRSANPSVATPSPSMVHSASPTHSITTEGPSLDPTESRDLIADISNLRLLHHFTTVTAKTLSHEPEVEDMFSCYIPKMAFDNVYLLHALLSLAALHMSRSEPEHRSEHLLRARHHHHTALTQFRSEVKSLPGSNFPAIAVFNAFIFPYSCAISTSSDSIEDAFESILSALVLTRMIKPLMQASGMFEWMRQSEIGRLMPKDVYSLKWNDSEPPVNTELVQLRKFSEAFQHIYPPDIIEAYKEAIRLLELLFDATRNLQKPPSDSLLRIWIHFVPARFVELLSEKQPGALIIFAHYGVILSQGRHYWFLEGMDELILAIADAFVPIESRSWLQWAKEQILPHTTPAPSVG